MITVPRSYAIWAIAPCAMHGTTSSCRLRRRHGTTGGWKYAFDIDTDAEGGASLHGEAYADGRLDWWSMDYGGASPGPSAAPPHVSGVRIPVPVRYAGMPASRYFEFEDGAVNLAATSAGPTAIATMVPLEYALAAGTDWFHLPLMLDYGHSFTVEALRVTDIFGRVAEIGRAGQGPSAKQRLAEACESVGNFTSGIIDTVSDGYSVK